MTLGTGVFLSSLFLGLVALFISTRDTWNWKKITKRFAAGTAIVVTLLGLSIYVGIKVSNWPEREISYWDVSINATKSDVKFLKGHPAATEGDDIWIYGKEDYASVFLGSEPIYVVWFQDDKVKRIECFSDTRDCPPVQGTYLDQPNDRIVEHFGHPSHISNSKDDLSRTLSYDRYNVFFELQRNRVTSMGVYDPSAGSARKYARVAADTRDVRPKTK